MKPYSKKPWATLNEQSLQKAAAAWNWLNYYVAKRGEGRGESLPVLQKVGDGNPSKFVPEGVILKHLASGIVLASPGNRTWGALGLPLQMINDEAIYCYKFMPPLRSNSSSSGKLTSGLWCLIRRIVAPPMGLS